MFNLNDLINEMEEFALKNDVPIITEDAKQLIQDTIKNNGVKNILEIGSAIGYSAICFASVNESINVTTIEKDFDRYSIAVSNINVSTLEDRITIINDDAYNFTTDKKFDLIFIDGAKSQYQKWFEMYSNFLSNDGVIVCDNLSFHGHVDNYENIESKNLRQLVRKIKEFKVYLEENKNFETTFYNVGDGISISRMVK